MRKFAPSLIALVFGVVWAAVFTKLIPVKADEERPALMQPVAKAACTGAQMVARLPDLPEASGLAVSRVHPDGLLWTHNDSGQPVIFALGLNGSVRGRITITGAQVDDWEDVAVGPCPQGYCLYIADIGDNKGARPHITIYRVPEPTTVERATSPAEVFQASYPDGAKDAEALFIGPKNQLFVVTKGEGSPITLYRFPEQLTPGATMKLERIATLATKASRELRITDADITWDGKWVALRTREAVEFYPAAELLRGAPIPPVEFDLSALGEPQGEGVAFAKDGTVYLAGEGRDGTRGGTLARMSCKLP
jgi:hypothetical protein